MIQLSNLPNRLILRTINRKEPHHHHDIFSTSLDGVLENNTRIPCK